MEVKIDTELNDAGRPNDPEHRKRLLKQRKWIILFCSFGLALETGLFQLSGPLGPMTFDIDAQSSSVITLSYAGSAVFLALLILQFYPFSVKTNGYYREQFSSLEIEESDIFIEEVEMLSEEIDRVTNSINSARNQLSNIEPEYLEIRQRHDQWLSENEDNLEAMRLAYQNKATTKKPSIFDTFDDPLLTSFVRYESLKEQLEERELQYVKQKRSIEAFQTERTALEAKLTHTISERESLAKKNDGRLGIYLVTQHVSDLLRIAPASVFGVVATVNLVARLYG